MQRLARLQPWYHVTRPRCDATTVYTEERCVFSASYTDTANRGINLCKTHADIADFPVKRIIMRQITLR